MSKSKRPDPKVEALRKERALNRTPDEVNDPLFSSLDVFKHVVSQGSHERLP